MPTEKRRRDVVRSMLVLGAVGVGGCIGRPGDDDFEEPTRQPQPDPPDVSFDVSFGESGSVEVTNESETAVNARNTGELFVPLSEGVTEAEEGSEYSTSRGWLIYDSGAETEKSDPFEPGDTRTNVLILDNIDIFAILWSPPGQPVTEAEPQILQQEPVPSNA